MQTEIKGLQKQLETLKKSDKHASDLEEQLKASNVQHDEEVQSMKAEINRLQKQLEINNKKYPQDLKELNDQLTRARETHEEEMTGLQAEISRLQRQMEMNVKKAKEQYNTDTAALHNELEEAKQRADGKCCCQSVSSD